jgi:hypothetical protein
MLQIDMEAVSIIEDMKDAVKKYKSSNLFRVAI